MSAVIPMMAGIEYSKVAFRPFLYPVCAGCFLSFAFLLFLSFAKLGIWRIIRTFVALNQTKSNMNSTKSIAALFDFDGVVMDTETQYSIFWNEQGRKYHPELPEFGRLIKGQTLTQIYANYFAGMEEVQHEITEDLNKFEKNMLYNYIPGVEAFLKELRENGVKIAIVTSSNEMKMSNVYKAHPELKQSVDRILTAEMFTHSKPDPECFLLGATVFDTVPENCVVFEDSFHGLEAGNRAGMTVIGLATTNPEEQIRDKANAVIQDFNGFSFEKMKNMMR